MSRRYVWTMLLVWATAGVSAWAGESAQRDAARNWVPKPAGELPSVQEILGSMESPYDGFGAVSVRPDGVLIIEAEGQQGLAFRAQLFGQSLLEQGGAATIGVPTGRGAVRHAFLAEAAGEICCTSAVYHLPGVMRLTYDGETAVLAIHVSSADREFSGAFSFAEARFPPSVAAEAGEVSPVNRDSLSEQEAGAPSSTEGVATEEESYAPGQRGQSIEEEEIEEGPGVVLQGVCEGDVWACVTHGENGARCCKKCPEGFECSCSPGSSGGCSCTKCTKLVALGVVPAE